MSSFDEDTLPSSASEEPWDLDPAMGMAELEEEPLMDVGLEESLWS